MAGVLLLEAASGVSAGEQKVTAVPSQANQKKSELTSISVSSGIESWRHSDEAGNPFVYSSLLDWELNSVKTELGLRWNGKNQVKRGASAWLAIPFRDGRLNDNDALNDPISGTANQGLKSEFTFGNINEAFRVGGELDKYFNTKIDSIGLFTAHKLDYTHMKAVATEGYVQHLDGAPYWLNGNNAVSHTEDIVRYGYGPGVTYKKQGKVFGFEAEAGIDVGLELSYLGLPQRGDEYGQIHAFLILGAEGKANFIVNMVNKDGKGIRLKLGGGVDVAKNLYGLGIELLKDSDYGNNVNKLAKRLGFAALVGGNSIENSTNFNVGVDVMLGK